MVFLQLHWSWQYIWYICLYLFVHILPAEHHSILYFHALQKCFGPWSQVGSHPANWKIWKTGKTTTFAVTYLKMPMLTELIAFTFFCLLCICYSHLQSCVSDPINYFIYDLYNIKCVCVCVHVCVSVCVCVFEWALVSIYWFTEPNLLSKVVLVSQPQKERQPWESAHL